MRQYSPDGKWILIGRSWHRLSDGFRLPVIQGGTNPNYQQEDFRFRNDDGTLATATWVDDETTNGIDKSLDVDTNYRLRMVAQVTNAKAVNNISFRVYYSHESGAYTQLTNNSTEVQLVDDANSIADHATTIQRIGDGTYVTGDAEGYNDGGIDNITGLIDFAGQDEVEVEICFQIIGSAVNNGDTIDFELYQNDGTELNGGYLDIPRATAVEVDNPDISESDSVTVADTASLDPIVIPNLGESDTVTVGDTLTNIQVTSGLTDNDVTESDTVTVSENVRTNVMFPWGDGFESGDISGWDSSIGSPVVNVGSAIVGSYGMELDVTQTKYATLYMVEGTFRRFRFYLNTNDATGSTDDRNYLLRILDDDLEIGRLALYYSSGFNLRVEMRNDALGWDLSSLTPIASATDLAIEVEFQWQDTTGFSNLWVDNVPGNGITDSDTATRIADEVRLGNTVFTALDSGTIYLDHFAVYDTPNLDTIESDTVTVGDTASLTLALAGVIESDNVTVTDTAIMQGDDENIAESDAVTVGDTASLSPLALPDLSESDSVTIADSASALVSDPDVDESDSINVTDTLPGRYYDNVTVTDSATVQVVGEAAAYDIAESDGVTVGDTAAIDPLLLDIAENDSVTVADAANVDPLLLVGISESEAVAVGDNADVGGLLLDIIENDSVTVADAATVDSEDLSVSESDTVTVADSANVVRQVIGELNVSESDGVTVTDSPDLDLPIPGIVGSETVTVADSATLYLGLDITESDSVTIADAATVDGLLLNISETDTVTIADSANVVRQVEGELNITEADGVNVGDTAILDALLLNLIESDTVTVADAANLGALLLDIIESDTVTVADSPSLFVTVAGALSIIVSDNVTLSENVITLGSDPQVAESDTVTAADSAITRLGIYISESDSVTVADATGLNIGDLDIVEVDTATIADTVTVLIESPFQVTIDSTIYIMQQKLDSIHVTQQDSDSIYITQTDDDEVFL